MFYLYLSSLVLGTLERHECIMFWISDSRRNQTKCRVLKSQKLRGLTTKASKEFLKLWEWFRETKNKLQRDIKS